MFEITLDEIYQMNQLKLDTQIQFKKTLAKGSFGTVILAYDNSKNKDVAVKIIEKENERQSIIHQFSDEISVLKKANHPNIVNLYDFFETKDNVYIIMEHIKGGTLAELMEERSNIISDNEARQIIKYLLKAVDHLHRLGICHRDIKPANIMFDSFDDLSTLKLIDFGLSTEFSSYSLKFCGTILFMSPERLMKHSYTSETDVWSIGIILYMLLHKGKHPFYSNQDNMTLYLQVVSNVSIEEKISSSISFFAKNLIKKLIEVNPSIRYSASFALHHPWISQDYRRLNNHFLKEEIDEFKMKQIEKAQNLEKESNQIETDINYNTICKSNYNIRKAKSNSFLRQNIWNKGTGTVILNKNKITTHLAMFSQLTPNIKHTHPSEYDSQSSFSTKDNFNFGSETQAIKSPVKFKVVKSKKEAKDDHRLSSLIARHSTFLNLIFSKKQKKEKAVMQSKNNQITTKPSNSYTRYSKPTPNYGTDIKLQLKKSKQMIPLVLPSIKAGKK